MVTSRKQVIIIGGGLSGLAAAVPLSQEGFQITVLEQKPFLGGRASSYAVPGTDGSEGNQYVDNCQHVLLKSCTNLIDFYERIGASKGIAYSNHLTFIDEKSRIATLHSSILPAPFHLLPSFLGFPLLKAKDKLSIALGLFCMLLSGSERAELDDMTMYEWLRRHHQTHAAIEKFWRTILVSALNEDIEIASAKYGIKVFLDGLLRHREAFQMGIPVVPLSQLYTDPSTNVLGRQNGRILLRHSVERIEVDGNQVTKIHLKDGSSRTSDYYISSVPPDRLLRLLPPSQVESNEYFSKLRQLKTSPITSIYLWFDRKITDVESAALLGREIQWIFNKNFADPYIGLVISASRKMLPLDRAEIVKMALHDLQELFPAAKEATLLRSVVIKEPSATFSCHAGLDQIRPDQKSPLSNFFVVGDWTQTGWPATMEGAVRSGYRAAELILKAEGLNRSIIQPDLPRQGIARLFPQ